jgi:hypothetical protein
MLDKLTRGFRSLRTNAEGMVDLGVVLMIGIAFVGLMLVAYIIWTLEGQLITTDASSELNNSTAAITTGFDDAVGLLLIAITIMILAIAISALLMLRGR